MPLPVDLAPVLDDQVVGHARATLDAAVEPRWRDDRFSDSWVAGVRAGSATYLAALSQGPDGPLAYLGGTVDRDRLRLEGLVAPHPNHDEAAVLDQLLRALLPEAARTGAAHLELWGHPALPYHEAVARSHAMRPVRALHQLRCPLPVEAEALPTRAIRIGEDDEAVLAVNNRAFAWHPDQGGWTVEQLRARFAEPWFDPDGFRVHEREGRVIGFCWTKVHPEEGLGEIYVIGIDPDHHGQGLGVPMTAAGLHWLSEHALRTGMLYVEADNAAALRTYERLGFSTFRTDRAWELALG